MAKSDQPPKFARPTVKNRIEHTGVIEMSPATNWHSLLQGEIISRLNELLRSGRSSAEVSIQTTDGVRVVDVAWTEKTFIHQYREQTLYQIAPAICVEIISPGSRKKEM